jgi:hypothetical protein
LRNIHPALIKRLSAGQGLAYCATEDIATLTNSYKPAQAREARAVGRVPPRSPQNHVQRKEAPLLSVLNPKCSVKKRWLWQKLREVLKMSKRCMRAASGARRMTGGADELFGVMSE